MKQKLNKIIIAIAIIVFVTGCGRTDEELSTKMAIAKQDVACKELGGVYEYAHNIGSFTTKNCQCNDGSFVSISYFEDLSGPEIVKQLTLNSSKKDNNDI